jgi:AraC-like DNA-binding protein
MMVHRDGGIVEIVRADAIAVLIDWHRVGFQVAMKESAGDQLDLDVLQRSFFGLFDALEDVQFWVKDLKNRYVHANRALLLNYDLQGVEEIVGKTDYDFSPPFCADQFWFDDEQVLKGRVVKDRIELVGGAGEVPRWYLTNKNPVYGRGGKVIGTTGTTRRMLGRRSGHGFDGVLETIRTRCHRPVCNRELADAAGLSVRTFERRFLAAYHVTPQQYIRKLRIRIACRHLVFTERSLAEIALESGFADQSHFSHEFRRHVGRTPRDYREHYRGGGG